MILVCIKLVSYFEKNVYHIKTLSNELFFLNIEMSTKYRFVYKRKNKYTIKLHMPEKSSEVL